MGMTVKDDGSILAFIHDEGNRIAQACEKYIVQQFGALICTTHDHIYRLSQDMNVFRLLCKSMSPYMICIKFPQSTASTCRLC